MPVRIPEVSVVLPAYNAAASIGLALDGLLAQTHPSFEILVVDDGSTDDTAQIITDYAARDSRVRPLLLGHEGVAEAFNAGIEAALGDFVARMDADDQCLPERLARQAAHLRERPDVGLVACCIRFGGDRQAQAGYARHVDWTNTLTSRDDIALGRFVDAPIANPSVMFRRHLVNDHGGALQGDFPEDYEMWLRWLDRGVIMEKLPSELLIWNDPPSRATRTDPRYAPEAFYRVKARYLARWLAEHNTHHPDVIVMGSGRTTRKRADLLEEYGVRIRAYCDVDPRKIGKIIRGLPVLAREDIPGPDECFALPFVASVGAREDIASHLESLGFVLGQDYIPAA
ncbi:glycosyltransferase family 2 protein [Desulfovibrio ferrophilus]|uniref:Glycosyl transferase 2 family protein n=1 Tax=Desulfovibrio ferrophilus TaxID=241368 RepID=A0A2Z6AZ13_9BACT|nr:glycosyltransferase family 2 protein [Desulfovibrio ferrophilus]BBD08396.1 glycosyl transferase 2 family protein [Desulfovibrio ferrophilus]